MTDYSELNQVARALVAPGKGILAIDETVGTCTKRFEAAGIESTPDSRRTFRELLVTAPQASQYVSGAILYDETLRQTASTGEPLPETMKRTGIIPGIKVDTGAKPLAASDGETVTEGLDGLRERLQEFHKLGARFTKWRAVFRIGNGLPSRYAIDVNAHALGRYAVLAQEGGLVPIVEPEVLMDGDHDIDRSFDVTSRVLHTVFDELARQRVALEGMILKPNMATPGSGAARHADPAEVAERTITMLRRCVPAAVPGVAFLSGGQSGEEVCANLNAMLHLGPLPWALSYSFGRALQFPALEIWSGSDANATAAQSAFLHRARMSSLARSGEYAPGMERDFAGAKS
jgi:fructose-bisphosphate aldolase class I